MTTSPEKWRPSLGMIVVTMLFLVLCLPLGSIWIFRFYDNHLVRETEKELIAQGAFIKAIAIQELAKLKYSVAVSDASINEFEFGENNTFNIVLPQLDLSKSQILSPRAEALAHDMAPDADFSAVGKTIMPILLEAQKTTLAGYRILDANGIVVAGREETGLSLAHVAEVKKALVGKYASVIRQRISDQPPPPIYSVSRGTNIRVFVSMPILYESQVVGVVYMSRTPSHFLRELYDQRWEIGVAVVFLLLATLLIAYVFVRTIKGPIDALNNRTARIAEGERQALEPLSHHGTREIANLSKGLLSMSKKLQNRTDYIKTFATHVSHELKSPLTSIRGAAELLSDDPDSIDQATRKKFLDNIVSDTNRLTFLTDRLRDLAAAESVAERGECTFEEISSALQQSFPMLNIEYEVDSTIKFPMPIDNAIIVFSNLADNAQQHGASRFKISSPPPNHEKSFHACDNGSGISQANLDKVLELFFTTRRTEGGTGMGLGIVQSILSAYDGSIHVTACEDGACFELRFR